MSAEGRSAQFQKGDRVRVTVGPSEGTPTFTLPGGAPAIGSLAGTLMQSGQLYYIIDCGHLDGLLYACEGYVYPAPPQLPPAVQPVVDIIRSNEIWGAWRVFLDNVWSFDLATKHRYRGLCGLVKYGFRVLDFRNAVCGVIGDDGKRPDLQ